MPSSATDVARHPELFGPDDREEALRDAVRLAVDDQLRAGADLITDGEMQRVDFNLGFYDYLTGIEPLPAGAALGAAGPRSAQPLSLRRSARRAEGTGTGRGISSACGRSPRFP